MKAVDSVEPRPEIVMTPAEAFNSDQEEVLLTEAVGRVAADFINLYPPGIPLLVPGEMVSEDTLAYIQKSIQMGLQVQGVTAESKVTVLRSC